MMITYVKVNLYTNQQSRLKAIASVTLNNCFVVHNIKVIERETGLLIAMPSIKNTKGVYVDVAHPINKETREMIETTVKTKFQEMIDTNESKIEAAINTEKEEELAVTNVKVNLYLNSKTRLKGKISITLNNCFVVHGIKVIDGEKGIFIAMPSIKNSKGIYVDIAHPINKETRQKIESSVIEAFQEVNENQEQVIEKDIF